MQNIQSSWCRLEGCFFLGGKNPIRGAWSVDDPNAPPFSREKRCFGSSSSTNSSGTGQLSRVGVGWLGQLAFGGVFQKSWCQIGVPKIEEIVFKWVVRNLENVWIFVGKFGEIWREFLETTRWWVILTWIYEVCLCKH